MARDKLREMDKIRVFPKFKQRLERAKLNRIANGVDNKMRSFPEMTEMLLNTRDIEKGFKELETRPKDEDFRKWKLGEL